MGSDTGERSTVTGQASKQSSNHENHRHGYETVLHYSFILHLFHLCVDVPSGKEESYDNSDANQKGSLENINITLMPQKASHPIQNNLKMERNVVLCDTRHHRCTAGYALCVAANGRRQPHSPQLCGLPRRGLAGVVGQVIVL